MKNISIYALPSVNLHILLLSGNQLAGLPNDVLRRLTSLTSLSLDHNQLGALPQGKTTNIGMVPKFMKWCYETKRRPWPPSQPQPAWSCPQRREQFLEWSFDYGMFSITNKLGTVPDGLDRWPLWYWKGPWLKYIIFEGLLAATPDLQDLALNHNNLGTVPEDVSSLVKLRTLDLGENRITELADDTFTNLSSLYGLR